MAGRGRHQRVLRPYPKHLRCSEYKNLLAGVDHDWLMKFLAHRIADPVLLRVIRRFLKAGVQEEGLLQPSEAGTPQGGLVSPVLANIYPHYVLDMWFEKRFARSCRGRAKLIRYADDFVACFTTKRMPSDSR